MINKELDNKDGRLVGITFTIMRQCTACDLHKHRRNVVVGRGTFPASILYIGEAPGKSEDLLGEAFVGPSGVLLDALMLDASRALNLPSVPSFYLVNTVMCRPTDEWQGDNRQPTPIEVCQCTRNIMSVALVVKPKLVVCVGKVAEKYYKKEFGLTYSIQHPAYILRNGGKDTPQYAHNLRLLTEAFEEL